MKRQMTSKPYIIKWTKADGYQGHESDYDLASPVFTSVTFPAAYSSADAIASALEAAAVECNFTSYTGSVSFVGTFSPVIYSNENRSVLFLGGSSTLYYPDGKASTTIGACRAYFLLTGIEAGNSTGIRSFTLDFSDSDGSSGIVDVDLKSASQESRLSNQYTLYSLDGRKLEGQPARPGIYVNNGRKIVVK